MSSSPNDISKVAILGAGVMGAQIAAHFANNGYPVVLFDLPSQKGHPNANIQKSLKALTKLKPAPLATNGHTRFIEPANYETDLGKLAQCELVIEVIAERPDWKKDLYAKIVPHLAPNAILATNTSGLRINDLATTLPDEVKNRFLGIHFFNPPRYMELVELIPAEQTRPDILNSMHSFVENKLGKGVVIAKDTPNFISNRVGVFALLSTIIQAENFEIPYETVDKLTGPAIGRPKSATFRTADVVGLDIFKNVVLNMEQNLQDDPWKDQFKTPAFIEGLVAAGALGQKTRAGVYKKVGKDILVIDPAKKDYRPQNPVIPDSVQAILKEKHPGEKLKKLKESSEKEAQFLWSIFRDLFQYCAVHGETIANNARDIDLAVRWGYGWQIGPFELWQAAGWKQVAQWVKEDIDAGKALCNAPLPDWVFEVEGVHADTTAPSVPNVNAGGTTITSSKAAGSLNFTTRKLDAAVDNPTHLYPLRLIGQSRSLPGETIHEDKAIRFSRLENGVGVLSFNSKMHAVGLDVLEGLLETVKEAEKSCKGLVLWQSEPPFSAGANLAQVTGALQNKEYDTLETIVKKFQDASDALKFSKIPTVAAISGMALGGGCEFAMHCDQAVAHVDSFIGLVEAGVGLLPAGGGCREFAVRAWKWSKGGDLNPYIKNAFETIAMAKVSQSAQQAQDFGFLSDKAIVVPSANELLYRASHLAHGLYEGGYRAPQRETQIPVAGRDFGATLEMVLVNMKAGGFISEHDYNIGKRVATILTGGDVDPGTTVSEDWLLELERHHFMELLKTEKTVQRIQYMLQNGKPLRN